MNILNYLLARLSESSTWRGGILLLTALGLKLDPELQTQILSAGLGVIGVINVLRKSSKK